MRSHANSNNHGNAKINTRSTQRAGDHQQTDTCGRTHLYTHTYMPLHYEDKTKNKQEAKTKQSKQTKLKMTCVFDSNDLFVSVSVSVGVCSTTSSESDWSHLDPTLLSASSMAECCFSPECILFVALSFQIVLFISFSFCCFSMRVLLLVLLLVRDCY